jgi:hypothetical protein
MDRFCWLDSYAVFHRYAAFAKVDARLCCADAQALGRGPQPPPHFVHESGTFDL